MSKLCLILIKNDARNNTIIRHYELICKEYENGYFAWKVCLGSLLSRNTDLINKTEFRIEYHVIFSFCFLWGQVLFVSELWCSHVYDLITHNPRFVIRILIRVHLSFHCYIRFLLQEEENCHPRNFQFISFSFQYYLSK